MLDFEINRNQRIDAIGAIRAGREVHIQNPKSLDDAFRQLDELAQGADYVVGHNIVAHDRRFIESFLPSSQLLKLPVIDSLYLAPLARPQRPYHKLVKDYKLVGGEKNNPVSDCSNCLKLLRDCWNIFENRERQQPGLVSVYRSCFYDSDASESDIFLKLNGTGKFLESIGARKLERSSVERTFEIFAAGKACNGALRRELPFLLDNPGTRPAAAYSLAWLTVAGTESILPRWVHHSFPATRHFLNAIRSVDCKS